MAALMRRERPSQQHEKKHVKQVWRKKAYCSHCDRNDHQRATCWRLHLEQHLKDKVSVREPGRAVIRQEKPPQGGDPFALLSEKWFLDMLSFHGHSFVNNLLHFKV